MKSKSLSIVLVAVIALAAILAAACPLFLNNDQTAYAAAGNYYNSVTATGGSELSAQLHDLIASTHNKYTLYADCKTYGKTTDPGKGSNTVLEFYTHTDIANDNWDTSGGWNREHVWAQSLSVPIGSSSKLWGTNGAGSDLHHIRPAEKDINNHRGNDLYGEVEGGTLQYTGTTHILGGRSSGETFEPLDNVKGDVARIVMYVYIHYSTKAGGSVSCQTSGNLPITNIIRANSEAKAFELLLRWNKLDPVDDIETLRNEEVFKIQGNRNPFIDNPKYADAIWGGESLEGVKVESISLSPNSIALIEGETQTLNVTINPANASNAVTWKSSNTSVATVANGVVTAVGAGTATITATSTTDSTKTATATVSVKGINGLEISGTCKKNYYAGDKFDPTGLTVKVAFSDGSYLDIDPGECDWLDGSTNQTRLREGTITVTCKYGALSATVSGITVKTIESLSVSGEAKYTVYGAGQTFIPEGLTVTALLSDGTSEVIPNDRFEWLDQNGSQYLTASSAKIMCVFGTMRCDDSDFIDIIIKQVVGITVTGTLKVTSYMVGDKFDPTGLTVTQTFNDNTTANLPLSACEWVDQNGSSRATSKSKTLVCEYGNFSANVSATLLIETVKEIVVSGTPNKTTYLIGNTINTTGLTVTVRFTSGNSAEISSKDCRWVDNANSETLGLDTKSFHCEYVYDGTTFVSNEISGITVALTAAVDEFVTSVNAIESKDNAEEKFQAIKTAAETYGNLSAEEQDGVKSVYNKLLKAVEDYNKQADEINDGFAKTVQTAILALTQTLALLVAAKLIVGKKG